MTNEQAVATLLNALEREGVGYIFAELRHEAVAAGEPRSGTPVQPAANGHRRRWLPFFE
jgi:hypothetical protein